MSQAKVTLVVVPRERFSYTERSLESIYRDTRYPFELIYIDGNSPAPVRDYLQAASQKYGFKLIRTEQYLSPNQARNIGIPHVETEYLVFIDNDVLVKSGWLEALVNCGDRTGAAAIAPVTLEGEAFDTIHQAGGEIIFRETKDGRRWMIERRPNMHLPLKKLPEPLTAGPTQLTEFHCVFARRDIFDKIGPLDEKLLSMAEETDFCLSVMNAGGTVYLEPASVVTYVPPFTLVWSDLPYFFMRWSDAWCETSVQQMREKYDLSPDSPVLKHYRVFVHDHRALAFGSNEISFKPLLLSSKISMPAKGKYAVKKILRHYMNKQAHQFQYSA
ncbi:glycosyltransferase family 2 protein [Leptolyngbya sp. PCC 6406]|uniref:glycosyltransferase family 2 protein n=1 Tax=Leptolyngbya sp. PCC 6406 TaxID=1173264 RepID=UPI00031FE195|nr:glycosyltransferase [Leptolyngbya sp. PCC 6406]